MLVHQRVTGLTFDQRSSFLRLGIGETSARQQRDAIEIIPENDWILYGKSIGSNHTEPIIFFFKVMKSRKNHHTIRQ